MRPSSLLALILFAAPCVAAEAAAVNDGWIGVNGTIIHYFESGRADPNDPVLLMVHGWCGSADDFQPLLRSLPDNLHCIAVDLPGCGRSEKPDDPYDAAYFQRFLDTFASAMGLRDIVLVGHSMGGQIAAHLAARRPDLLERLILIDPYGLPGEEGGWASLARSGCFVDFCFSLNTKLFISWGVNGRLFHRPTPALVDHLTESTARSMLGADAVRAISRITRNLIGQDTVETVLPGIRQPVFIIWGDYDQVLPLRWAASFMALLPQASLSVVTGTGHMPMLEKPGESARLIEGFVFERDAQRAERSAMYSSTETTASAVSLSVSTTSESRASD